VALFRIAQAPQSGFQALSAPARMVLLTEQTRDREQGKRSAVLRGVRRYSLAATVLMLAAVPPLYVFLPSLVKLVYGSQYGAAGSAARVFLLVAAVQFVVGWTKSFPVAVGRPSLRTWTHGAEALAILPLVPLLGAFYGATGAAVAVLVGMLVFAVLWLAIFLRTDADDVAAPRPIGEATALEENEAEILSR
jgi:O-antigen/teichoic acid export membrane protein